MTTKQISLNSTVFHPSDINRSTNGIGKTLESVTGVRRRIHRALKKEWEINWTGVSETIRAQIEAIANLTASFTLVDFNGTSYTVQCEDDRYSQTTDADHYNPGSDTLKWDVTLKVFEA